MSEVPQFKEWKCECKKCQKMCERPCIGTVEDIKKIIEAGFGDRLCLDWQSIPSDEKAVIRHLTPALKGHESNKAPGFPGSEKGCTFWKEGKCELHPLKLKPLMGKTAIHNFSDEKLNEINDQECTRVKEFVMQGWQSKEGQDLVDEWCDKKGITDKDLEYSQEDFMKMLLIFSGI